MDRASISASNGDQFTVINGGSLNISCTLLGRVSSNSYSIIWKINSQTSVFNYTNVYVKPDIVNLKVLPSNLESIHNHVVSTLHIVKARYPTHEGTYQCVASNSNETLSASIAVRMRCKLSQFDEVSNFHIM